MTNNYLTETCHPCPHCERLNYAEELLPPGFEIDPKPDVVMRFDADCAMCAKPMKVILRLKYFGPFDPGYVFDMELNPARTPADFRYLKSVSGLTIEGNQHHV